MISRLLFTLFLLKAVSLHSQPHWQLLPKIERDAYTTLEGSIDNKYPISMHLDITWNYCGPNDNNKWNPRIIRGWYSYNKIGKKIPLLGSRDEGDEAEYYLKLYAPKNLLDTLDGNTCTLEKYKELFFIPVNYYADRYSLDTMQWTKYGQQSSIPVYLREVHPFSWKTRTSLTFQIDNVDLLEIDLGKLTSNEYIDKVEIEASKEVDGKFYFIIRYGHLTSPGWFGSGMCGAGWEEWLALLSINNELEIEKFEIYQTESCSDNIYEEYIFDKSHPEQGISLKKY